MVEYIAKAYALNALDCDSYCTVNVRNGNSEIFKFSPSKLKVGLK